jgi:hypothetical protein
MANDIGQVQSIVASSPDVISKMKSQIDESHDSELNIRKMLQSTDVEFRQDMKDCVIFDCEYAIMVWSTDQDAGKVVEKS